MWVSFALAVLLSLLILYLPGLSLSNLLCLSKVDTIIVAPLISLAFFFVIGEAYFAAGFSAEWWQMVLPAVLLGILITVLVRTKRRRKQRSDSFGTGSFAMLALYIVVGISVAGYLYVKALDGSGSFAQIYDNAFHLNLIHAFSEYGVFSALHAGAVFDPVDGLSLSGVFGGSLSFYPAGWHIVCALVANGAAVDASVAENAVNFVFMGVVLPSSLLALLSFVFSGKRRVIAFGSLCSLAFAAFPWGMLTFGPLYSNMAAFCLVPAVCFAVFRLFCRTSKKNELVSAGILLIFGGISLGLLQPNAIFAVVVLALPYCVNELYGRIKRKFCSEKKALAVSVVVVLLTCTLWVGAWASPMFAGVVEYYWPAFAGKWQALVNVIALSLTESPAQIILGMFVIAGVLYSLYLRRYRWAVVSFLLAAIIYCACATSDGAARTLFSGFWYNDPYRTSSLLALAGMPLAAMGLSACVSVLMRFLGAFECIDIRRGYVPTCLLVALFFSFTTWLPNYSLNGLVDVETAFGRVEGGLNWLSAPENRKYTVEEASFMDEVMDVVDQDPGIIYNFPFDGSVFSYADVGAPIYYRNFSTYYGGNESDESITMRLALGDLSQDDEVKNAVEASNVKYVLLLDTDISDGTIHEDLFGLDSYSEWAGILALNDLTDDQSFELMLSEGDMRLYKVSSSIIS